VTRRTIRRSCRCAALLALAAIAARAGRADAQETQLDLHGSFAVGTTSHSRSWGAGLAPQFTFGSSSAPVKVSLAPGFDYLKQEAGGPSQENLSLDANLQPGGSSSVTPYVGASASANWSSGSGKQWSGSKLGLETMGGLQMKAGDAVTLKAEERFGYVEGQEHTLTTRLGVLLKL
jgi:hypothetical protein